MMDEASFRLIAHGEKAGSCYTQNAQGWIFKKVRGAEVERVNVHCPPAVMRNKTNCLLCCHFCACIDCLLRLCHLCIHLHKEV